MAIIWFLIIAYIIYIAYKSNNKVEQVTKNINDNYTARQLKLPYLIRDSTILVLLENSWSYASVLFKNLDEMTG